MLRVDEMHKFLRVRDLAVVGPVHRFLDEHCGSSNASSSFTSTNSKPVSVDDGESSAIEDTDQMEDAHLFDDLIAVSDESYRKLIESDWFKNCQIVVQVHSVLIV